MEQTHEHGRDAMKLFVVSIAAAFVFGCGSTSSNSSQPSEEDKSEKQLPLTATAQEKPVFEASNNEPRQIDITGMWENSSCGDRKYRRQVNLVEDGQFNAVDEVAPCPPDKKCVWSGIIRWNGTWTLKNRAIALDVKTPASGKLPETIPEEFVVLGEDPVSIGERGGDIICPYQKRK
jgi:hypothetical protein